MQNLIVDKFPTISILDVERTGKKILSIVEQMTQALQLMAVLSVLAGLVILYSISKEKVREQRWEINLLKVLGASFKDLKNQVRIEFGLLGFCASLVGVTLSSLFSFVLAEYIFDRVWSFEIALPILIIFTVVSLSILMPNLPPENCSTKNLVQFPPRVKIKFKNRIFFILSNLFRGK